MSDAKGQDRNARIELSRPSTPRLELKKTVEGGVVRQSFSHGRSKSVAVEVKRSRVAAKPSGRTAGTDTPAQQGGRGGAPLPQQRGQQQQQRRPMVLKPLTDEEKAVRLRALSEAKKAEDEARKRAEENAHRAAEEAARRRSEEEAAIQRKVEEEARKKAEDEARRKAEEQARRLLEEEERRQRKAPAAAETADAPAEAVAKTESPKRAAKGAVRDKPETEEESPAARRAGKLRAKTEKRGSLKPAGRDDKRTLRVSMDGDEEEGRVRSLASLRRQQQRERRQQETVGEQGIREVVLPDNITVQELANRMAVRGAEVVKTLMRSGVMATINQAIDADTAELVVAEFGQKVKRVSDADVEEGIEGIVDQAGDLRPRAPVVTVMGHVDHGKTSLLDALRESNVVKGEAGGITQHIGAYRVDIGHGMPVAFIDTPGHAAFTSMRARGASVTDVVVLVVAADDGVMPQTVEAIRHAKAAGVPIVVAINKMDKPEANPERVKTELLNHEVVVEDYGGEVLAVPVSAMARTGIDKLIEALQLQAELLDLKANPERDAQGTIVEAELDRGRGAVATVLVQNGTLKVGDIVIAGAQWGRVRALVDDRGAPVEQAGPSTPVEILGLDGVPEPGDKLWVVDNEKRARDVAEYRQRKKREQSQLGAAAARGTTLEDMFSQLKAGALKELPVVIKADVHGSLEAIVAGLDKLKTDEVGVRVLHGGVGAITESDVSLALASRGLIMGFNVRANVQARDMAKREGIEIRYYSIIYEILDEAKAMLSGMLSPEAREVILGHAEIREIFSVPKFGKIAGCRVLDGLFKRNARVRLLRDDVVIFDGQLGSLRRFKDDVREVKEGFECGMSIEGYNDIREGDVIEAYEVEEVARSL
ncbi:translation initiation factor IF-2 [Geminicoccaceae bacterium 1502E]|nr:translation initiation factor IF-2 [Geminicoccaceae bacterium 1502E]